MSSTRRDVLAAFLGVPLALSAGCSRKEVPLPDGEIVGPSDGLGHRLRQAGRPQPAADRWQRVGVVIVGGGVAGLSAAWRLRLAGLDDFVVVELEPRPGGTSRWGSSSVCAYPWGADYLPVPLKENRALVGLLAEMGVVEGTDGDGEPVVGEEHLVRDPGQRIGYQGVWYGGDELYLHAGASRQDVAQRRRFEAEVLRWAAIRDGKGRPAFAIPVARGSDDPVVTDLDRITMQEWLDRNGYTSARLRWMVDCGCRDDYGAAAGDVSAWAGLFYFVSRKRLPSPLAPVAAGGGPVAAARARRHPGPVSQPYLAWPEGNGRIVRHLLGRVGRDRVHSGRAVAEVIPVQRDGPDGVDVVAIGPEAGDVVGYRADRVVFAAPQFVARYVIRDWPRQRLALLSSFEYSVWLVANLHLSGRPAEVGAPLAWDNVLYDSPSLGYVAATHQAGIDHGPTVWTWYYPMTDGPAREARTRLLGLDWKSCADLALADLERAHDDLRPLVERADVMRWGHAMPRPAPGHVFGGDRARAVRPYRNIHFAHSDLSGVGIMEEAFYHGVRAAEEVLSALGRDAGSIL